MSSYRRFFQNQEAKERERMAPSRACDALEEFRRHGEVREFLQLEGYLAYPQGFRREITEAVCGSLCRHPRRSINSQDSGFMGLTLEEYRQFETAWKATQTH